MDDTVNESKIKKPRKQTATQKLTNFLRSPLAKEYPLNTKRVAILHALASYFYYSETCFPSISSIMEYALIKKDKIVTDELFALQAVGLISIHRENGVSNTYTWRVPYVPDSEIYNKKVVGKSKRRRKPPPKKGGGNHPLKRGVVG